MKRGGPLLAAGASAVVIAIAILMFVLPKMSQVSSARADLSQAKDQEQTLQGQLSALKDAQAAAPETKAQIAKLQNLVPLTADLPALIQLLSSVTDRSSVDFFTMSPGTPSADASGNFSTIITQVNVTGGYFSLVDFLYRVETLQRAAKVTSIALTTSAGASGTGTGGTTTTSVSELALQMTVEFYTTDSSAGPGSIPGASTGTGIPGA